MPDKPPSPPAPDPDPEPLSPISLSEDVCKAALHTEVSVGLTVPLDQAMPPFLHLELRAGACTVLSMMKPGDAQRFADGVVAVMKAMRQVLESRPQPPDAAPDDPPSPIPFPRPTVKES